MVDTTAANANGLCGKRTGGTSGDVVAFYVIPNPMGGCEIRSRC